MARTPIMSPDDYRSAAGGRRSYAAAAAAHDIAPIRQASPEEDGAKPEAGIATRAYDAFAVGAAWLNQIAKVEDTALLREGSLDLKLFDALLDDDVAYSAFQQRRLAITSRPWTVEPGNPDDPRSVQAADDLRAMLDGLGWDRVCDLMLYAKWYGYGVAEGVYEMATRDGRTLVWLDDIVVPDRKWFTFTNGGELRMKAPGEGEGVAVPPNKFWTFRTGATHDFAPFGTGLAHWCYWPVWFKKNVLSFWTMYLEKYGVPTAVGFFQDGTSDEKVAALLASLRGLGSDTAVAFPIPPSASLTGNGSGPDLSPKFMEAQRGGGADSYKQFVNEQNEALTRIILSQTMTSKAAAGGIGSNQADVHKDVRDEVVKADSDGLHESFNRTFPVWLTRWNYGPDVAPPTVFRKLDDEEDLGTVAKRDIDLKTLGWVLTEEAFRERYGEGYERAPEPVMDPRMGIGANGGPPIAANDDEEAQRRVAAFAARDPAPLYVRRDLINTAEVLKWAREQGFTVLEASKALHVTVLASRAPVDWFAMGTDDWGSDDKGRLTVSPGGPRKVEPLGPKGAIVLHFASDRLRWRHEELLSRGASSDYPEFLAHLTFTYDPGDVDLAKVQPYQGKLVFGPEYFAPMKEGQPSLPAAALTFSAEQSDVIDQLALALGEESDAFFVQMGEAVRDQVAEFAARGERLTLPGLRIAMMQALEEVDPARFARIMAMPFLAERAATQVGAEDGLTA